MPGRTWVLGLIAVVVGATGWWWSVRRPDALVVYCAHDAIHAEAILAAFTAETGIAVEARYDNEATKSLGLVEAIARERDRPRCDVLWNNEVLGTMWLAREGLLATHRGSGWQRMPPEWRDAGGRWVGFGGRLRVWIHGPDRIVDPDGAFGAARAAGDLSSMGFARPVFGTTRAHFTAIWSASGGEQARSLLASLEAHGARELSGNASVKDAVAAGSLELGWTDTDDAFVALDAGADVAFEPILWEGRALCIPNTAAVIQGSAREADARRLVDWLASEAGELRLARSRARQLPLGPLRPELWPEAIAPFRAVVATAWDVRAWDAVADDVLAWLRRRSLR